jgi:hypothetical protein
MESNEPRVKIRIAWPDESFVLLVTEDTYSKLKERFAVKGTFHLHTSSGSGPWGEHRRDFLVNCATVQYIERLDTPPYQ